MNAQVQNSVSVFQFQPSFDVRVIVIDGNPWFVASDVAAALEYRDAANMTRFLDDDDKGTHNVSTPSGSQQMTIINESGLYSAILKSRKPEAKKFKKWVTSEVLPSIRKTGSYTAPVVIEKMTGKQEIQIKHLVWNMASCFGHKESASQAVWNVIRVHFGLKNFTDLPATRFEEAVALLEKLNRDIAEPYKEFKHDLELTVIDQYLGQALPWTPYLKRELMRKFKEAIPNQPNWLTIAQRLGVEGRRVQIDATDRLHSVTSAAL